MRKIRYSSVFFYLSLFLLLAFMINDCILSIKLTRIDTLVKLLNLTDYPGITFSLLGRLIINYLNLNINNGIFTIIYLSISVGHFILLVFLLGLIASSYQTKQWDISTWLVLVCFIAFCGMIVKLSLLVFVYGTAETTLIALVNINRIGLGSFVFDGAIITWLVYLGVAYPRTIKV